MYGYIMIVRPKRCAVSMLSVLMGIIIALSTSSVPVVWNAESVYVLAASLISFAATIAAGNTINDYFDREHNKVNKPWRPIPSGKVSPSMAMLYASALFLAGMALAGTLNYLCFIISTINSILLIIYSKGMQDSLVAGKTAIGYISASSVLFGAAAFGSIAMASVLFLIMMFLISSTEIIRGLEDFEGDRKFILKTIVSGIGKKIAKRFGFGNAEDPDKKHTRAQTIAFVYIVCAMVFSLLPYAWGMFGVVYLLMLVPANAVLAASLFFVSKSARRKQFAKTRSIVKKGLYILIFAFVLASVFSL